MYSRPATIPGGADQSVHESMRKAVFVAEFKVISCMGCIAESVLDSDGRSRNVGEQTNRDRRKSPDVPQGESQSSSFIHDLVAN